MQEYIYLKVKENIDKIKNSEFVRNVLTLSAGTLVAQAIPAISSLILARLYSPENFGTLALYLALVNTIAILATGRYETAVMIEKKEKSAVNLMALILGLIFITVFIFGIIVLIFNNQIIELLNDENLSLVLYFLPISIFFQASFTSLNLWANKNKQYKKISFARIIQSLVLSLSGILFGLFGFNSIGLIISTIFGVVAGVVLLFISFWQDRYLLKLISFTKIKYLSKRYIKFPKFTMPAAFINTLSGQAPIFLLSNFFMRNVVGYFSFTQKILSMPMSLIGASIGQVYFQQASKYKDNLKDLSRLTIEVFKKLALLGIVSMSLIMLFGDYIFAFVFGAEWKIAGEYARYISVWLMFAVIYAPISPIFSILERQNNALIYNIILFLLRVAALFIGGLFFKDALITVILYSITSLIAIIGVLLYIFKILEIKFKIYNKYLFLLIILPIILVGVGYFI